MTSRRLLERDPGLLTEAEFSGLVVGLARLGGWKKYHAFDSRRSTYGWPDWTFCRNGRLIFAELKSEKGKLTPQQEAWLVELNKVPCVEVYVWKPSDWPEVVEVLTGKRQREAA